MYKKVCKGCGKGFETRYKQRKFCSWKCYQRYRLRRFGGEPPRCLNCGTEIKGTLRTTHKFCSIPCAQKWRMDHSPDLKKKMQRARWDHNPYNDEKWVREMFEEYKKHRGNIQEFAGERHLSGLNLGKGFKRFMPAEYEAIVEGKMLRGRLYLKGRNFEYRVRNLLKGKGYFVLRSPRSGGLADLVALKLGKALLIQCKVHRKSFSKKDGEELVRLAESVGGIPVLAYREPKAPRYPIHFINLLDNSKLGVVVP